MSVRYALYALAAALAVGIPDSAAARRSLSDEQTGRLMGLCQLWGSIKYFHPKLAYERIDWDKALVDTIPAVEASKTRDQYRAAIQSMVAHLHDPSIQLGSQNPEGEHVLDHKNNAPYTLSNGILSIDFNAVGAIGRSAEYQPVTEAARKAAPSAKGFVLDCRGKGDASSNNYIGSTAVSKYLEFMIHGTVGTGSLRRRFHDGYKLDGAASSGTYHGGLEVDQPDAVVGTASESKPIVFLIDAATEALVFSFMASLQDLGIAKIVSEGNVNQTLSEPIQVPIGDGLFVTYSTAELVSPTGTIGFSIDKSVKGDANKDVALAAALDLAQQSLTSEAKHVSVPTIIQPIQEASYADSPFPNAEYRLLALFRYWNAIQYLHPYKSLIEGSWGAVLEKFIPKMLNCQDATEYGLTVLALSTEIHDPHTFPNIPQTAGAFGNAFPPIRLSYLEDKLIVAGIGDGADGSKVALGDEVVSIDGKPIALRVNELTQYSTASRPELALYDFVPYVLAGKADSRLTVGLKRPDGTISSVEMVRVAKRLQNPKTLPAFPPNPVFGVLASGQGYIDLGRLQYNDVAKALDSVKGTSGLILDLRAYPNGTGWTLAGLLAKQREVAAIFRKPVANKDSLDLSFEGLKPIFLDAQSNVHAQYLESRGDIQPASGVKYDGKIVVLVDHNTFSQGEHTCLLLEAVRPVTFIGSETAGGNGDYTQIALPGGILLGFSGQQILHGDGRQLQRIGIVPQIKVSPTVAGRLAGRDEVLEAAVRFLAGG